MVKNRRFLFFLQNAVTGACYWYDQNGHLQQSSISSGTDHDLTIPTPAGWDQMELGFMKNMTYMGFNRSFSMPTQLVKDAAKMAREIFYTSAGRGTETPLKMTILKFNDNPLHGEPMYQLYYAGPLDLPNWNDKVATGVMINMMEGGVMQVLKAFENKMVEIPCDGSIPENIKANMDGTLYEDTMRFQFVPMGGAFAPSNQGVCTIAMGFLDEDGDSFGVQRGDQTYEVITATYPQSSGNFSLSYDKPTTIGVSGYITVRPFNSNHPARFNLGWFTSLAKGNQLLGGGHSGLLFPRLGQFNVGDSWPPNSSLVNVGQQSTFYFDQQINLAAGENIFFYWSDIEGGGKNMTIVGGQCNVKFKSQATATYPWGMSLYDAFRLVWKSCCDAAGKIFQPISFVFDSQLLQQNLNIFVTPGDAVRASGDPNYHKFYNAIQTNPNFPNINETFSYGPVLKITLRDIFEGARILCFGAAGNQQLMGQAESLFFEAMDYVFNSTGPDTFDMGEVSDMEISVNHDFEYNILQIGYPAQTYDQKSGKYETNTTAEWILPFKSFTGKILKLICPIRTDSYALERLRSNLNSTSSTRNDSDNSVFAINVDRSNFVYDLFKAFYQSGITDPSDVNNTDFLVTKLKYQQGINLPSFQGGGYFLTGNEPAIFILNQASLISTVKTFRVDLAGTFAGQLANVLTGTPADTVTIKLFINGVVNNTWIFTATDTFTNWSIVNYLVVRPWSYKDSIYMTIATSAYGTARVTTGSLQMDTGGAYWQAAVIGILQADPGTANQLISFPAIAASLDANHQEVVSYGFQYFLFNSIVVNNNFTFDWHIEGFTNGNPSQHGEADFYQNGLAVNPIQFANTGPIIPFTYSNAFNRDLQLGDIFWITVGAGNMNMWVTAASITWTSTQTKAFNLKRVKYDVLTGVPNLALDANGNPDSSLPGAPYNIEDFSPKRLFEKWFPFIKAICFDQVPGTIYFNGLTKNRYLSTSYQGKVITEAANVLISDMGDPLFIPRKATAKLMTPNTFQKVLTGAANSHIRWTYGGVPIFGFGMSLKQRPAYMDAQEWELLLSPKTDMTQFVDLNISGLKFLNMPSNSLFYSFRSPFQWFPEGKVLPSYLNVPQRDQYPFADQITRWINTVDFRPPWQNDDPINLQFITNGLGVCVVNVYKCGQAGTAPLYTFNMAIVDTPALTDPYYVFEIIIDPSAWGAGIYTMEVVAGASGSTASILCQPFDLQSKHDDTVRFKLSSSVNKQDMVFDTGYNPVFRVPAMYDNRFEQKFTGQFYIDQNQGITVLNAVPYEETRFWVGTEYGCPDWMFKKVMGMLLLDEMTIEDEAFSVSQGAEWNYITVDGAPLKFGSIIIRPVNNNYGVAVPATMQPEDSSMIATVQPLSFGPNAYNEAQTTDSEIVQILLT